MPGRASQKGKKRQVEELDSGAETDYDDIGQKRKGKAGRKGSKAAQGRDKRAAEVSDPDSDVDDEEDGSSTQKNKKMPNAEEIEQLVQDMLRHVLFTEYNRKPIRRDEITKAVLPGKGRYFPHLLERCQKVLNDVLGMELVLMRNKEIGAKANVPSYVLRSTIPLPLLAAAQTRSFEDLVIPAAAEMEPGSHIVQTEICQWDALDADQGLLRDPKREEGGIYGLLGVILSLILVNGKVLGEDQLVSYLKRLNVYLSADAPLSPAAAHNITFSAYLTQLTRQGYLEKTKSSVPATTQSVNAAQDRRGKNDNVPLDAGDPGIEWRWGARADIEIGEIGIANFIQIIWDSKRELAHDDSEDAEDVPERPEKGRRRGKETEAVDEQAAQTARTEKLMREIARAAGATELVNAQGVEDDE